LPSRCRSTSTCTEPSATELPPPGSRRCFRP
jgi:hypothetical protein